MQTIENKMVYACGTKTNTVYLAIIYPYGFDRRHGCVVFFPLDEAIASKTVIVIVSVSDCRTDGSTFEASQITQTR